MHVLNRTKTFCQFVLKNRGLHIIKVQSIILLSYLFNISSLYFEEPPSNLLKDHNIVLTKMVTQSFLHLDICFAYDLIELKSFPFDTKERQQS